MRIFAAIHCPFRVGTTIAVAVLIAGCGNGGGSNNQGTSALPAAKSVRHAAVAETIVHSFEGAPNDGADPQGGLLYFDGTLYGTTGRGSARVRGRSGGSCDGALGCGTVFVLKCCWAYRVVYSFLDKTDGETPNGNLIYIKRPYGDEFYGTTRRGGADDHGTVFAMHEHRSVGMVYSFNDTPDGHRPFAGLIGGQSELYGTTVAGGAYDKGSVYEIEDDGANEKILHSFGKGADGAKPQTALIYVNGEFYGTTSAGGSSGKGTIFKINKSGDEAVLHSFAGGTDGADPRAALIDGGDVLYGTTSAGGTNNQGTVFDITTSGKEKVLHSFGGGSDGADPEGAVSVVNGTLYGTTCGGGTSGNGTLFSIKAGTETVLYSFGGAPDGSCPTSNLLAFGTFYGITAKGGESNFGTVFSIKL